MATSRKQITTYLPPELVQALEEWQQARGITSISAAVVAILQDYLQGRSTPSPMTETLDQLIETRIAPLQAELEQLKHQVEMILQVLAQTEVESQSLFQAGLADQDYQNWEPVSEDPIGVEPYEEISALAAPARLHPHFQPGDWVRYYFKGRNLIEQVLEVYGTETGIDQLLLPSGQMGANGPELDLFPATMVTPHQLGEPEAESE